MLYFSLSVLAFLAILDEELQLVLFFLQTRGSMAMDFLADNEGDEIFKSEQRSTDQSPYLHQWSHALFSFLFSF